MPEAPLPDVDLARIRPYGQPPSRAAAFEELASILIEHGVVTWPDGVRFERFGNPDGGREGRGILPNGDVWAWQAKYLFDFDAAAVSQVSSSVRRVIDLEPNLKRYLVAMPFDLPAGDTSERTSAHTRWTQKVTQWQQLAAGKGLTVEFQFVGAHELLTVLTESRHAGRARYWFAADVLTPEWQSRRLEEAIDKAGRRYTPRLHVEVDTVRALDAVGRTAVYAERWKRALADLRESRRWSWRPPKGFVEVFTDPLQVCAAALDTADAALTSLIAAAGTTDALPPVMEELRAADHTLTTIDELLHEHTLRDRRYFVDDAGSLYRSVQQASTALHRGEQIAASDATRAASLKRLLLTGRAGVGKTHLLCDVASRRLAQGQPTVLLLGQDFDGRSLLPQIAELAQLGSTLDDLMGALAAAAEAAGCLGLLMIDAINESERPERWRDDVRALMTAAARFSQVGVVLSCRTEFVESVFGDADWPSVGHVGFAEATDVAVRRFTEEYGLEPPTFPVLSPDFSNPLFLKLTCEALATLGAHRFPFGAAGLETICDAFLEAVNKRLADPARCDYDEHDDPVRRVVRELAALDGFVFDRSQVQAITDVVLPRRSYSKSLLRGLITEGVLIELSDGRLAFGYQRLGDVARAVTLAENSPENVRQWLRALEGAWWQQRGVLGALAVVLPERHGVELVDLAADEDGHVDADVVDAFLESLLLRAPAAVPARATELLLRMFEQSYRREEIYDHLVRIALVPGHRLNAEWLHGHLGTLTVADRDASWSRWLIGATEDEYETAVTRLFHWAWPAELGTRGEVPHNVAELATLLFSWLFTSTDRRVRDRATKALVSVAERAPAAFARTLPRFADVNDPYVLERLAAAACGVALRAVSADDALALADGVRALVADGWPLHLMTRDYLRRVLVVARGFGLEGAVGDPPYGADWPVTARSVDEIEALAGGPDYLYGSIWHSLTGLGDFGRYVLQSALGDVASDDPKRLQQLAERAVFDRTLELGWTPERFRELDRGRSGRDEPVERFGKKYQWIAFYEVLGRLADQYQVRREWSEDEPRSYLYPEQLVWRDIDPTVLVRKPELASMAPQWFSPVEPQFPAGVTHDYPADLGGVPDPLDLICVTDEGGASWLTLATFLNWEQPLPVEVQALHPPRRSVWMHIRSYLVPVGQVAGLRSWAVGQDWYGRWMPEHGEAHNALLGAHPDDPTWTAARGDIEWWEGRSGKRPADLWHPAAWYGGTGTSREHSSEGETQGFVPSKRLFHVLGLGHGVDFTWRDSQGVAIHDPSATLGGSGALLLGRDRVRRLTDAGVTLFWTVLLAHELHTDLFGPPDDNYRWVSASASYVLVDSRVERVNAMAARCAPGPRMEYDVQWAVKPADA